MLPGNRADRKGRETGAPDDIVLLIVSFQREDPVVWYSL